MAAVALFMGGLGINIYTSWNNPLKYINNAVLANEGTNCPKVGYKSNSTVTWEESFPLYGDICMVFTYKGVQQFCRGKGEISCCPGINSFEVLGTSTRLCK